MQYEAEIGGRLRRVVVHRTAAGFVVDIDGEAWTIDAARLDACTMSLLLEEGGPPPSNGSPVSGGGCRRSVEVTIASTRTPGDLEVNVGGRRVLVTPNARRFGRHVRQATAGPQRIVAPMPGRIVRVLAAAGTAVRARDPIVVIEAMKMENELRAIRDGVVAEVQAREGQSVEAGVLLAVINEAGK